MEIVLAANRIDKRCHADVGDRIDSGNQNAKDGRQRENSQFRTAGGLDHAAVEPIHGCFHAAAAGQQLAHGNDKDQQNGNRGHAGYATRDRTDKSTVFDRYDGGKIKQASSQADHDCNDRADTKAGKNVLPTHSEENNQRRGDQQKQAGGHLIGSEQFRGMIGIEGSTARTAEDKEQNGSDHKADDNKRRARFHSTANVGGAFFIIVFLARGSNDGSCRRLPHRKE